MVKTTQKSHLPSSTIFSVIVYWLLRFQDQNLFEYQSQGTEKIKLFSQGINNFQILGNETLVTADYKCVKI